MPLPVEFHGVVEDIDKTLASNPEHDDNSSLYRRRL